MSGKHEIQNGRAQDRWSTSDPNLQLATSDLHFFADAIPHIMWAATPDGSTTYINRWGLEYTDLPPEVDIDKYWDSVLSPGDADRIRAAWAEANRTGHSYELDCRIRRADGQFRWHCFRGQPVRRPDGRIIRWVGTATDIDDQKTLEESLRLSEHKTAETLTLLETLQAAAPIGLGFVDHEFRIVRVNDSLATTLGLPVEQLIGQPVAEVIPNAWPLLGPIYHRVLDTGEAVRDVEVTGVTASEPDRVRSWLGSYFPVRVDAEIAGVGVIVVDITERVAAEAFRSVVMEKMAEGLYTLDDQGHVTSVNRAACEMLGWTVEELLGRRTHDVVHFQQADGTPIPADECPMVRARTEGRSIRIEDDVFTRKDGSTFPVSYSSAPLHVGLGVAGTVVVFRDITDLRERQRREVEDRHEQKLESLGRLSAGIAHEINTPIQFVGDNTRFLADAYQEMLDLLAVYRGCMDAAGGEVDWDERIRRAAQAERAADIDYLTAEVPIAVNQSLEGVERVASLVRAMKSFSYKDSTDRSYADLNEALTTTLTVARNEIKYVADVVLDLGELPEVLCRIGDLNQVFLNLVVNAADAMEGKGARGEIRIRTRAEGEMAVIRIADNGCGIPEHLQKMIFEPFFTTKEVGRGTGQGLALARAVVVDGHAGAIEVHSTPGEGTEFVLRLPVHGKAPEQP
ncbi:PAS domain-containing protein [Planosporangium thailandense]|uniref:histidine kinase n=1 Tax=Planosporangium thailandense TaxID=765197 RepID=A0ABX0Y725_9ACTN|nr:PAS domain-containing protein [Planosporangium thailandense]NJC74219.1 PAS domain-containing protein [Planosporangium thailandense]